MEPLGTLHVRRLEPRARQRLSRRRRAPGPLRAAGDMVGVGERRLPVPSHDLVVVRLGHYKGETIGAAAFRKALTLLMEAVPRRN
jgi:hypothetical protein